jgi:predicted nucleic acid-binding protein
VSALDPRHVHGELLYGARQITGVYLLALAVEHGGRFVTFDHSVPLDAVPPATAENLMVL